MNFDIDESILLTLSKPEQEMVKRVIRNVKSDNEKLLKLCHFLQSRLKDKDWMHFGDLSEDIKFQACIGHLVVNVLSGSINSSELKEFV